VLRLDGKQIGYIEREMAARLVDDLTGFSAFVAGVVEAEVRGTSASHY
jgi:hypothetical protein